MKDGVMVRIMEKFGINIDSEKLWKNIIVRKLYTRLIDWAFDKYFEKITVLDLRELLEISHGKEILEVDVKR